MISPINSKIAKFIGIAIFYWLALLVVALLALVTKWVIAGLLQ